MAFGKRGKKSKQEPGSLRTKFLNYTLSQQMQMQLSSSPERFMYLAVLLCCQVSRQKSFTVPC